MLSHMSICLLRTTRHSKHQVREFLVSDAEVSKGTTPPALPL